MKHQFTWLGRGMVCAALLVCASGAMAQFGGPLTVRAGEAVNDVIGRRLPDGTARVEIRRAHTPLPGVHLIVPPDQETGEGSEFNPLERNSHIGAGMLSEQTGRFSETFDERLGGAHGFVRIFDRLDPGDSLYYLDSVEFPDDGMATSINVDFSGRVWKLVSTSAEDVDSDGDGIPDEMELDMGLDPGNPDTDGDGWDDLFEVIYSDYLNPIEPDEPLTIHLWRAPEDEEPAPGSPEDRYTVGWWTFPGPLYVLEFHPNQVDAPDDPETGYIELWSGTVSEGESEKILGVDWVLEESPTGFFRVRAIAQ